MAGGGEGSLEKGRKAEGEPLAELKSVCLEKLKCDGRVNRGSAVECVCVDGVIMGLE